MKKIATLSLSFLLLACSSPANQEEATQTASATDITQTTSLQEEADAQEEVVLPTAQFMLNGTLIIPPTNHFTITLPMGGIVSSIKHIPGSFVQKGEIIAKIQNPEFIALQQSYLEADAQSAFLELEYKRQQNLLTEEATSQKRLQESRSEYLTIKSKKEAAEVHLRILGVDAKELATKGIDAELVIRAPRSGYLSELSINQGKYVEAGEAICQIIDKSELLLQLTAYEKDLARVEVGQTLSFRANGVTDKNYKAIVSTIGQYVDPVTRAVQVYAKVNGANINFKPGMYVVAELAEN